MATFALIASGAVVQTAPASFPVHPSLAWVDVTTVSPAPQAGWAAVKVVGVWTFTAPTAPAPADTRPSARRALDASDLTMLRCFEHGLPAPADWVAYRAALRVIFSGTSATTPLPACPAFPAGT